MVDISVILCTHNPRRDYLHRVLAALSDQTAPRDRWELVIVDNASDERLADTYDVTWHAHARHVREDRVGLTPARLRGIAESRGELLVFVDDDNVLMPDFLESASAICGRYPYLGVVGAGNLDPEFEVEPPTEIRSHLKLLALRTVSRTLWSNNARDFEALPWGAGLCVRRQVAELYIDFVKGLDVTAVLGRKGKELFCGEDDVFSWVATSLGYGFGIFPQLRLRHLIPASRLNTAYLLRLARDHAFSHSILRHQLQGLPVRRVGPIRYVNMLLLGARDGLFSMKCQWAEFVGEASAARFIRENQLQPHARFPEIATLRAI